MSESYRGFEADYALLERSLELSSQELLQANAEMRAVLQALPDVFMWLDSNGTILACRAQYRDELLEPAEALVGRKIQRLPNAEARGPFESALERLANGLGVDPVDFSLTIRGEQRNYEARLLPLRAGQVLAVIRNISERKRAEVALIEAREAALEAVRLKSEFLANMSHEIRTPMTCIIGMTELTLGTELSDEQRYFLDATKNSADALLGLINDILDFSKIEAGKLKLDSIPFSLRDCVGTTLKSIAIRAHQKSLELACHVAPDAPDRLVGDPGRLRQILINLVGNAIKFTDSGEVVVRVTADKETGTSVRLRFAVHDTGIGIPGQKQKLIFGAFMQADGSPTRRHGGSGLGLAICTQLAELMQGSVSVESDAGHGSTFTFTATLELEPAPGAPMAPDAVDVLRDLHVLIVDDNATIRSIFSSLLARVQAREHTVDSGEAALAELSRAQEAGTPYQLVLMDVQMPGMDGFAAAERIRGELKLDVPIVVLTSSGQPGDAARCRAQGVSGYLTKPVMSSELLEAIRAIFGGVPAGRRETFVTRHSLREERARLRLLLAEDHPVNRVLITRMLERRGHKVCGVENGRQVLESLAAGAFDLVLMDLQMPELDGFETTAAIRNQELGTDRHIPIVALTAHATDGVSERCLQSGMDAYVSKPIRAEKLFGTIEGILSHRATDIRIEHNTDGLAEILDIDEVLRATEGDRELLAELVQHHLDETSRLMGTIRAAVQQGDAATLQLAAHRLRGGLGALAARAAVEAAHRLETLSIDCDAAARQAALASLEHELERLAPALSSMLNAA